MRDKARAGQTSRWFGTSRSHITVGSALLVDSFVPWLLAPFVPLLGLGAQIAALAIVGLGLLAESLGAVAVLVLGRAAYVAYRRRFSLRRLFAGPQRCTVAEIEARSSRCPS